MLIMVKLVKNSLTPEIYKDIRSSVNMKEFNKDDVKLALENSLFTVVAYDDEKPVGIGRVIGDGRIAFFIKDVAVIPSKQGKGIGHMIMNEIMAYIRSVGASNAYVGLMALKDKEGFYKDFGFHIRPYKNEGSGMTLYFDEI